MIFLLVVIAAGVVVVAKALGQSNTYQSQLLKQGELESEVNQRKLEHISAIEADERARRNEEFSRRYDEPGQKSDWS